MTRGDDDTGNGAREMLAEFFEDHQLSDVPVDWFLAQLWLRGFKVVPVDWPDEEPPEDDK